MIDSDSNGACADAAWVAGRSDVALVCMPWQCEALPSIQIGILKAFLERESISAATFHLNLQFLEFGHRQQLFSVDHYRFISQRVSRQTGLAEWIFLTSPLKETTPEEEEHYLAYLERSEFQRPEEREQAGSVGRDFLRQLRAAVPAFMALAAEEILSCEPKVVGFTTMFYQTNAALGLAKALKARRPGLKIVFGGASCDGPAGPALLRSFDCIDVVVRGEAEGVLAPLMSALIAGKPVPDMPGLCVREVGGLRVAEQVAPDFPMQEVPCPDYEEYFRRLAAHPLRDKIEPYVEVLYESGRGCWWGQKHHCTFCGLNGQSMKFRSKPSEMVLQEIRLLRGKYGHRKLMAVDNIIENGYFSRLLPQLAESGLDISIWAETKTNLTRSQIKLMHAAGLNRLNAGIESLSTDVLRIMRKGVSALQNIRTLKWAAQYKVKVSWVILYGFPGEQPSSYAALAQTLVSLTHLMPPNWPTRIRMDRFSPIHSDPAAFGLTGVRPYDYYPMILDVAPDELAQIAYHFDFDYGDRRDPDDYIGPVREAVSQWRREPRNTLQYARMDDGLEIRDRRAGADCRWRLGALETDLYDACDAGATPESLHRELSGRHPALTREAMVDLLEEWRAKRLVYFEDRRYLSLAVARSPEDERSGGFAQYASELHTIAITVQA